MPENDPTPPPQRMQTVREVIDEIAEQWANDGMDDTSLHRAIVEGLDRRRMASLYPLPATAPQAVQEERDPMLAATSFNVKSYWGHRDDIECKEFLCLPERNPSHYRLYEEKVAAPLPAALIDVDKLASQCEKVLRLASPPMISLDVGKVLKLLAEIRGLRERLRLEENVSGLASSELALSVSRCRGLSEQLAASAEREKRLREMLKRSYRDPPGPVYGPRWTDADIDSAIDGKG